MKRVPEGRVPPQDASPRLAMERGRGFWPTGTLLRHILGQEETPLMEKPHGDTREPVTDTPRPGIQERFL